MPFPHICHTCCLISNLSTAKPYEEITYCCNSNKKKKKRNKQTKNKQQQQQQQKSKLRMKEEFIKSVFFFL